MRIENIFGLHLGCQVKCKRINGAGQLFAVAGEDCTIIYDDNYSTGEHTKDCKLLLKPLSAITEEDLRDVVLEYFDGKITINGCDATVSLASVGSSDYDRIWYVVNFNTDEEYKAAILKSDFKLKCIFASRGYSIGIVPDEYKEIVE